MNKLKISIFILLSLYSLLLVAEESPDEMNRVLAIEMSKCFGAQEAVAEVKKSMGKVKGAEHSQSIANATRVAAELLFYQSGMPKNNLTEAVSSYSHGQKLKVLQDFENSKINNVSPDVAIKIMSDCSKRMMPLQEQLIEQLRQKTYESN